MSSTGACSYGTTAPSGIGWTKPSIGYGFPSANIARQQIQQGILRAFSIGFRQTEPMVRGNDGFMHIVALDLLECSVVSLPANSEALFSQDGNGKLVSVHMLKDGHSQVPGQ